VGPQKYSTRLAVPISISKRVTLLGKVQDIFRHESGKKEQGTRYKKKKMVKRVVTLISERGKYFGKLGGRRAFRTEIYVKNCVPL
jgi:hypothetical protein